MRTSESQINQARVRQDVTQNDLVYAAQLSYHELADVPVRETDVIEQLENNLKQLTDLQARMQFMMKEIRYLMKV